MWNLGDKSTWQYHIKYYLLYTFESLHNSSWNIMRRHFIIFPRHYLREKGQWFTWNKLSLRKSPPLPNGAVNVLPDLPSISEAPLERSAPGWEDALACVPEPRLFLTLRSTPISNSISQQLLKHRIVGPPLSWLKEETVTTDRKHLSPPTWRDHRKKEGKLTWLYHQRYMEFQIIKPPSALNAATVGATVRLSCVLYGQGHIPSGNDSA